MIGSQNFEDGMKDHVIDPSRDKNYIHTSFNFDSEQYIANYSHYHTLSIRFMFIPKMSINLPSLVHVSMKFFYDIVVAIGWFLTDGCVLST